MEVHDDNRLGTVDFLANTDEAIRLEGEGREADRRWLNPERGELKGELSVLAFDS